MPKRKCKQCKEYVEDFVKVPAGVFCSIEHAIEFANSKQKKERERQVKKAKKEIKSAVRELNRNTLPWQHKHTQDAFNKMRVREELLWFQERGLEPTCISCGRGLGGDQWCCGHFKTVGAQGVLRYDRMNTKLQHNRYCNMGLSGDIYGTKNTRGYVNGLLERFGTEEGQKIIDYCETKTEATKWTCEQLEAMRKEYNKTIRELERKLNYC